MSNIQLLIFLSLPLIAGVVSLLLSNKYLIGRLHAILMICLFCFGLKIVNRIIFLGSINLFNNTIYLDALSGLMIILITLVSTCASIYSIGYMLNDVEDKNASLFKIKIYYLLFSIFVFTMLLTVTVNSIGLIWIAIELTTLVSAFLVGFYNKESSVEASWKYIILCTVGISIAMIGIIISYYAVTHAGGIRELGLNWDYLLKIGNKLDPHLMKIAFIFILIGFGTKAGLAPMHTWLPDAHSEAPTPVSALLSGVLIKCAIYGIIRFTIITNQSTGAIFTSKYILIFGLISIGLSALFILTQKHIKRLLAYSSLEHIGIITCGIAFANPLSIFGALFHMLNHAMVKSLMFFSSGNLSLKFHTKDMEHLKGVIQIMPISGLFLLLGGLALGGMPPFSVFLSEFYILSGAMAGNHFISSIIFALFLIIVFGGLSYHFLQIALGPVENNHTITISKGEISRSTVISLFIPFIVISLLGIWIPSPLLKLLNEATRIISTGY